METLESCVRTVVHEALQRATLRSFNKYSHNSPVDKHINDFSICSYSTQASVVLFIRLFPVRVASKVRDERGQ